MPGIRWVVISCCWIFLPVFASEAEKKVPSYSSSFGSVLIALFTVLIIVFLCAWLLKRINGGGLAQGSSMQVVSQQMLGQKERLVIIKVDGEHLLLGVTAQSIQLIKALSEEFSIQQSTHHKMSFQEAFSQQIKSRFGKKGQSNDPQ